MPDPEDVSAFLKETNDTAKVERHAEEVLPVVTEFVRAYTGGRGFDPETGAPGEDVAAVIVTSTARLMANPDFTVTETIGPYSVRWGTFAGWTLPELAVLHRYRRRAA